MAWCSGVQWSESCWRAASGEASSSERTTSAALASMARSRGRQPELLTWRRASGCAVRMRPTASRESCCSAARCSGKSPALSATAASCGWCARRARNAASSRALCFLAKEAGLRARPRLPGPSLSLPRALMSFRVVRCCADHSTEHKTRRAAERHARHAHFTLRRNAPSSCSRHASKTSHPITADTEQLSCTGDESSVNRSSLKVLASSAVDMSCAMPNWLRIKSCEQALRRCSATAPQDNSKSWGMSRKLVAATSSKSSSSGNRSSSPKSRGWDCVTVTVGRILQ
mmetsp:Transcript_3140/g.7861  ORF Transcript_3140/g.7861 Transcript_3140/m.7861 type:complete len:286 (-) Transcript_3140:261-1118(-)